MSLDLALDAAREGWYVYLRPVWLEGAQAFQWVCTLEKPPVGSKGTPRIYRVISPDLNAALRKAAFEAGVRVSSRKDSSEMAILPTAYQEQDWKQWVKLTQGISLELTEGQLRWLYDITARSANNLQPGRPYGALGDPDFRSLVESIGAALLSALPDQSPVTPQSKPKTRRRSQRSSSPLVTSRTRRISPPKSHERVDTGAPSPAKVGTQPNTLNTKTQVPGKPTEAPRVRRVVRPPRSA